MDVFTDLYKAWEVIHETYKAKQLAGGKVMFYYLTLCVVVIAGLYMYLYYQGCVGFAVLFSAWSGVPAPINGGALPPINIVHAIGIILILRYVVFAGLGGKKEPEKFEGRLREIESKVGELHKLAFGDVPSPEQKEAGADVGKESTSSSGKDPKDIS